MAGIYSDCSTREMIIKQYAALRTRSNTQPHDNPGSLCFIATIDFCPAGLTQQILPFITYILIMLLLVYALMIKLQLSQSCDSIPLHLVYTGEFFVTFTYILSHILVMLVYFGFPLLFLHAFAPCSQGWSHYVFWLSVHLHVRVCIR